MNESGRGEGGVAGKLDLYTQLHWSFAGPVTRHLSLVLYALFPLGGFFLFFSPHFFANLFSYDFLHVYPIVLPLSKICRKKKLIFIEPEGY